MSDIPPDPKTSLRWLYGAGDDPEEKAPWRSPHSFTGDTVCLYCGQGVDHENHSESW